MPPIGEPCSETRRQNAGVTGKPSFAASAKNVIVTNTYEGKPVPPNGRFAVVVSRFNETLTSRLLDGAVRTLAENGVSEDQIDVFWVPGAFEIPTVAARLAGGGRYVALICLGVVIRGETTHDQHINRAVSTALAELGARHGLPVIFGVLTCNTLEQAIARSGGEPGTRGKDTSESRIGNKGCECALAALEMVDLLTRLPR